MLFDVDCTMIDAHGAGGRAMFRAMDELYGVRGELDGYSFHGRTDPAIIVDLATRWGAPEGLVRERLDACLERYVEILREELSGDEVEVLPGVRELVTALAVDRRVVLGVLTGNVAGGLALKLSPTGLLPLFEVEASGSDSALRPELPRSPSSAPRGSPATLRRQGDRRDRRHAGRHPLRRRAGCAHDRRGHRPSHASPTSRSTRPTTCSPTSATGGRS